MPKTYDQFDHGRQKQSQQAITPLDEEETTMSGYWKDQEHSNAVAPKVDHPAKTKETKAIITSNPTLLTARPLSRALRPLVLFLKPFGFSFWSKKKQTKCAFGCEVALRLGFVCCLAFSIFVTLTCVTGKKRFIPPVGCTKLQSKIGASDIGLAFACFAILLCNGDKIRDMITATIDSALMASSRKSKSISCLLGLSRLLVVLSVLFSVLATLAISNADLYKIVGSIKLYNALALVVICVLRLLTFVMVSLMVTVYLSIAIATERLIESVVGGQDNSLADFDLAYHKVARLVHKVEACFSGQLPIILTALFVNIYNILGKLYLSTATDIILYSTCVGSAYHVTLFLLLFSTIVSLNAKLKTLFAAAPLPDATDSGAMEINGKTVGVYSPYNSWMPSRETRSKGQQKLQPLVVTAGGIPVSTWFMITAAVAFMLMCDQTVISDLLIKTIRDTCKPAASKPAG